MSSITPSCSSFCWADLPPDLLMAIADRLNVTSTIRLSTVCTSWACTIRSHLPSLPPSRPDRPIPWLLLSVHQNSETGRNNNHTDLTFYDVSTVTSYSVPVNIPLLRVQGQRWLGSYKGWLAIVYPAGNFRLVKPLTGARVCLPFVQPMCGVLKKVVIWKNIDELLVIFCLTEGGCLWMAKVGDRRWTPLHNELFQDIIIYQGKLYATSWHGLCRYDPQIPTTYKWVMKGNYGVPLFWKRYLLEWKGELIVLLMEGNNKIGMQYFSLREIKLYKVNLNDVACRLIEVTSIGNNALFFSPVCSYVLPTSASGCDDTRENCVYLTDQVSLCPCHGAQGFNPNYNLKVYNLEDRTITPFCPHGSPTCTTQPIFFLPC